MVNDGRAQLWDSLDRLEAGAAALIAENRDIFRLLKHQGWRDDPYSMPVSDADIESMMSQHTPDRRLNPECRVFFAPYVDTTETSERSQIRVFTAQISPVGAYLADIYLQVDVIVNLQVDKYKGGRRMNALARELFKSLNGQEIGLLQPLELYGKSVSLRQFKDSNWGYSLVFRTGVGAVGA
jgi:hypothetical protein